MLFTEGQIVSILKQLLELCVKLHGEGATICNLHPGNIFIDEENFDGSNVLVTDVGFGFMPGVLAETQMQL